MPCIEHSTYRAPRFFGNCHVQTCFPTLFRRIRGIRYERERIRTPDEDFLDLDWSRVGQRRLVVVSHGLEGCSDAVYVRGMVRAANLHGWDALAWNFRGCSGTPNDKPYWYHSGKSEDLNLVVEHVLSLGTYEEIGLVGFSVGGNITLKYLSESSSAIPSAITSSVTFSVPTDLAACAKKMKQKRNVIYMKRFLQFLYRKVRDKSERYPDLIQLEGFDEIKSFEDYDSRYTAPLNGFGSAQEYWQAASSGPLLDKITIPTLVVNARDDSFLGETCYPKDVASVSTCLFLETPSKGGHAGFVDFQTKDLYWSEARALSFLSEQE